jgi:hypothetical protein
VKQNLQKCSHGLDDLPWCVLQILTLLNKFPPVDVLVKAEGSRIEYLNTMIFRSEILG